jgi:DNA modification methylase
MDDHLPRAPLRDLQARRMPLCVLTPDPANPRIHDEANLAAIKASLQRFGQAEPLVVQLGSNRIIAGHGRLAAMEALGWTEASVVELNVHDLEATALGIALNRSGELARWDDDVLSRLLGELRAEDALDGVGFDEAALDALIADLEPDEPIPLDDPGPEAPPDVPASQPGDLWLLGDHRLLAGDSTNADDVSRVMAGEQAALCATDPPYLVDYTGERPNDSGKDWTADYREIDIKDADGFFRAAFTQVLSVLGPHAAVYCWHAHKRCGDIQRIWRELGLLDHQQIIWIKPAPVFGRVYWHFRHEPCVMGWRQGSKPDHDGHHEHDSVWEVDWDGKARVATDHPTSKPTELFARPMRKHTKPGDVVFEPFSGSGSQLIAAESLGRRCRAIEISPAFVDVAVRRWEAASGKQATLGGDGRTFAEVAVAREAVGDRPDERAVDP